MGIGHGIAEMFLEAGATVAINGRKADSVTRAVRDLHTPRAIAVPGDVASVAGCRAIVDTAVSKLGGLEILVNNVGICPLSYMMDVTEEHWDEVIAVNLRSALFCSKFALPALRRSQGNIVMVASIAGLCAGPTDSFVYAISKGGMVAMTKGLAIELAPDGVRVNAVCPGYIDTPMIQAENAATGGQVHEFIRNTTPLRRLGSVRECASSVLYFASDLGGYCTGTILSNDGGCMAGGTWGGANAGAPVNSPSTYLPTPTTNTLFDFTGRRVLITGSTLGIGRAAAEGFLSLGATVAVNGRTPASVARAIREMGGGPRLIPAPGDLAASEDRRRTVAKALADLGGLDVLVNNAGRGDDCVVDDLTEEYWQRMTDLNLKAGFFVAQACVPELRKTRGNIIHVSSILGLTAGPPGSVVYATTKGAVVQMMRMMALALAPDGVRVNAFCPGWIDTPMIQHDNTAAGDDALYKYIASVAPVGRVGTPQETVGAILYLAAAMNSYTTGAILSADGGLAAGH